MDDQRLSLVARLITEMVEDRRELLDALRAAVALALVREVPAKVTIVRWSELLKKVEGRE